MTDDEKEEFIILLGKLKEKEKKFEDIDLEKNFEYSKKPTSRRGLHLIGVGRNIKKIKK